MQMDKRQVVADARTHEKTYKQYKILKTWYIADVVNLQVDKVSGCPIMHKTLLELANK